VKLINEEIISFYKNCKSLQKTSLMFTISIKTLRKKFKEIEISTKINKDHCRNIKIKYEIDEEYFEEINTSDKAYILGLLYADGHMYKSRKQIRLKLTDIELLEKVKEKLNYLKPLNNSKKGKKSHKEAKILIICNTKIYDDLIKLGCKQNKTYNCQFPNLNNQYISDFIRGFFDGDGCIYVGTDKRNNNLYAEVVVISTNDFIYALIDYLKNFNIKCKYFRDKKHDGRIGKLRIQEHESLFNFYLMMYHRDNLILLNRKYEKYKNFLISKKLIENR